MSLWLIPLLFVTGCGKRLPGSDEVPPGVVNTPGVFQDVGPRWSHDGARIAFFRRTADRKVQLCIASADLRRVTPLLEPELLSPDRQFRTSRVGFRAPEGLCWSPDDRTIVFPRVEWMTFPDGEKLAGTSLWKIEVRSGKATPLAVHPVEYKGALYHYRSPDWSPDGKHIVFIGEGMRGESALFMVPAAGARSEIESPRPDSYQDSGWPAWSPDGRRLVFRQGIRRGYSADLVETVRVTEPGGLEARRVWATTPDRYDALFRLRPAAEATESSPERSAPRVAGLCWSPDGNTIAFTASRDAADPLTAALWALDVRSQGGKPVAVSVIDGLAAPVWIDDHTFGAVQVLPGGGYKLVRVTTSAGTGERSTVHSLASLPTADLDWSPDRKRVVVAGAPSDPRPGEWPPSTTLRLISTGI